MCPVGVSHKLKLLIVFDQFVEKQFCILVMYIVIARTMDIEQVSLQIFGVG
jgi:hypothetical protein